MTPGTVLLPADGKDSTIPNRALLGQLRWVARCSRPDIMAAVSVVSKFCTTYRPEHYTALKQVLRYPQGAMDYKFVLRATVEQGGGISTVPLCIYTDADHAGCKVTRRSTSGIAVFFCGSLMMYSSIIQKCGSLFTTEAEIIAMSEGAREVNYVLNVLSNMIEAMVPVPMYCGNQGSIHLASNYVNNNRSKKIDVRDMHIREQVKAVKIEPLYTNTNDNVADIHTKPLCAPSFTMHRQRLGIMELEE
ncbi:hypothetical protein CYMTET_55364 [Cymbomonas tetramitiformis]|uniref:Uncharacterized protein n=1 Tax=Cymbomonas tetramitiformis TaxID=36881 RepID=A0AAE0BDJ6_9CHLO|nr:hypothetical protein CYMTET_55364 [Cymbomonas tetramitiformis]